MTAPGTVSVVAGFRFPREVISIAVRWYLRSGLSSRDVGELLAERGITAGHVTVYRWVPRCTAEVIEAAGPGRHVPGNRWFVEETCLRAAGQWAYVDRAVEQHGQVIDVLVSANRDPGGRAAVLHPGRCAPVRSRPRSPPAAPPLTHRSSTS